MTTKFPLYISAALLAATLPAAPLALSLAYAAPPKAAATYANPVLGDVADPFVFRWRGEYYLYRTAVDGTLDVHTSDDLVHWTKRGSVWKPDRLDEQNPGLMWAPELVEDNGTFYLYFSDESAKGDGHRLWVATAKSPLGPFKTTDGPPLSKPWRIDVDTFLDDDGKRYLYSCVLSETVEKNAPDTAHVQGRPFASLTDKSDAGWVDIVRGVLPWEATWVEAPTVWRDPFSPTPRYYLMYSGGGADKPGYHTGYATATSPLGPWTKRGVLIDTKIDVPGPGHQSWVYGPDLVTPYLVYHVKRAPEIGWARDFAIDPFVYGPDGSLQTHAPTTSPQPMPRMPRFSDRFTSDTLKANYAVPTGTFTVDTARQELTTGAYSGGKATLKVALPAEGVVEVYARAIRPAAKVEGFGGGMPSDALGTFGVSLAIGSKTADALLPTISGGSAVVGGKTVGIGAGFDPLVFHVLRVTRRGAAADVRLDNLPIGTLDLGGTGAATVSLVANQTGVAFSAVALSEFAQPQPLPTVPARVARTGWKTSKGIVEQRLLGSGTQTFPVADKTTQGAGGAVSVVTRGWATGRTDPYPKYGVRLLGANGTDYIEAWIDPITAVVATHGEIAGKEVAWQNSALPLRFDAVDPHRLGIAWDGQTWRFSVDGTVLQSRQIVFAGALTPVYITNDARATFEQLTVK